PPRLRRPRSSLEVSANGAKRGSNGMSRRLFHILGKRAFLTFGFVAFVVGVLLAAIDLTSRHALKRYVEYQLARIPWDVALYQKGPSGGEEKLRDFVRSTPGVTEVASLAFMR